MFEKVNPSHPDKVADRIAGALVDIAYANEENPKVAIEVLIGHGTCYIVGETDYDFLKSDYINTVARIAPEIKNVIINVVKQDVYLACNQKDKIRCGDNGIFKGVPVTEEQKQLTQIAVSIYNKYPTDGKYILADDKLTICQSNASNKDLQNEFPNAIINPLGEWTGGTAVDTGATNRKLGSDMADSVTGGGLHGKDLSKADVSVNIYAWVKAQMTNQPQEFHCSIGDEKIDNLDYEVIVNFARNYIEAMGGFEKFAEWGLVI